MVERVGLGARQGAARCAIGVAGLLAALSPGCARGDASAGAPGAGSREAAAPREVRLVRVAETAIPRTIAVTGTLAPDDQVDVRTMVAGRLASIAVDLGTPVRSGETIAKIDPHDFALRVEQATAALASVRALAGLQPDRADDGIEIEETGLVREARATLDEARANLERARSLGRDRSISAVDLDIANFVHVRAQSALQRAREEMFGRQALVRQRRSELDLARRLLDETTIRAPFDGTVRERLASAGAVLATGAPVATIVRVNPLRLRVEVAERDSGSVKVGQTVRIRVDGDRGSYPGRVARLSPSISELNRVLVVEAEIQNPGHLRPGAFARGEVVVDADAKVAALPASAITSFAGIEKAIAVADGKAVEKPLRTGRRAGGWIEVLGGLAAGEAVVAEPGNLQHGEAVTVARDEPAPLAPPAPAR